MLLSICNTKRKKTNKQKSKIKPIASATSVTTVSALEEKQNKQKNLWYLTNQLTTTASDKPERIKNNNKII